MVTAYVIVASDSVEVAPVVIETELAPTALIVPKEPADFVHAGSGAKSNAFYKL